MSWTFLRSQLAWTDDRVYGSLDASTVKGLWWQPLYHLISGSRVNPVPLGISLVAPGALLRREKV
jgi:hypothetical protein